MSATMKSQLRTSHGIGDSSAKNEPLSRVQYNFVKLWPMKIREAIIGLLTRDPSRGPR